LKRCVSSVIITACGPFHNHNRNRGGDIWKGNLLRTAVLSWASKLLRPPHGIMPAVTRLEPLQSAVAPWILIVSAA